MQPGTLAIDMLTSTPPSSWRRARGRPRLRWAEQIIKDTHMPLGDAVTATHDMPSWRSLVHDATCPATQANLSKQVSNYRNRVYGCQFALVSVTYHSLTPFIVIRECVPSERIFLCRLHFLAMWLHVRLGQPRLHFLAMWLHFRLGQCRLHFQARLHFWV